MGKRKTEPPPPPGSTDRWHRFEGFVRDYTAGMSGEGVRRLFERDAARAYGVLARDQGALVEPKGRLARLWHRTRTTFLGLSYKLTPPRRLLFALAILAALLGLSRQQAEIRLGDQVQISTDTSPILFVVAIGCLVVLLVLELADRVLVRDELEVARGVQRDLIPERAPELPGWSFAHSYRTPQEVGGDYYDFVPASEGRWAVVVGDASGHGMAAGLVMAMASATLRAAIELDPRPAEVAALLDRALRRRGRARSFMTLFYLLVDPATGHADWADAGHPFPLVRRDTGEVEEVGRASLPLAAGAPRPAATGELELREGDLLVLYSDGLVEAVDSAGEAFGYDRLRQVVAAGGGTADVHRRILEALDRHLGGESLGDDLTLVVIERVRRGPDPGSVEMRKDLAAPLPAEIVDSLEI